jgi:HK97 family phage portal protein
MGLRKFFRNFKHLTQTDLPEVEERGANVFSILTNAISRFFSNSSDTDSPVSTLTAMRISTVFTCVMVRAESLSTLPVSVMQSTNGGSRVAYSHPVYRLIHTKPNPFQTASSFWKSVSAHIDLYGNCFAIVSYSGRYQPTRIDLVEDPSSVQILESESGNAYYEYNGKRYQDYEILHFKDISLDGYYGCSRIQQNADTIGYAGSLRKYGRNSIKNRVEGYFTTQAPFDLIRAQEKNLQAGWKDAAAEGKIPFLPLGLKFERFGISPNDAQYLESINATKEDIYGIFRIPPTLAQNYERATFANAEQQDLVFVKHTMLPIITNIEQECNAKLFSEANATSDTPYYVKFNVNAFLRGDFTTRTQGYKTLWERGLITGNMVADFEDWNHYEGGDERFIPMNMIPLSQVKEFIAGLSKPVNSSAGNDGGADNQARSLGIDDLLKMNGFSHTDSSRTGQGIIYNTTK